MGPPVGRRLASIALLLCVASGCTTPSSDSSGTPSPRPSVTRPTTSPSPIPETSPLPGCNALSGIVGDKNFSRWSWSTQETTSPSLGYTGRVITNCTARGLFYPPTGGAGYISAILYRVPTDPGKRGGRSLRDAARKSIEVGQSAECGPENRHGLDGGAFDYAEVCVRPPGDAITAIAGASRGGNAVTVTVTLDSWQVSEARAAEYVSLTAEAVLRSTFTLL